MSAKEAQAIANNKNLDLVMISPNANPPVCKIWTTVSTNMNNLEKKRI